MPIAKSNQSKGNRPPANIGWRGKIARKKYDYMAQARQTLRNVGDGFFDKTAKPTSSLRLGEQRVREASALPGSNGQSIHERGAG